MSEQDFKSPLPPREINKEVLVDPEEKAIPEIPENRPIVITESPVTLNSQTTTIPPKKNNKKLVIAMVVGVVILMLALGIFLIFSKKEIKKETITLNYRGLWEDPIIINSVIADFESKNPGVKINYKRDSRTDYRTRLLGRLTKTGSENNEDVDVFRIHNTWIPMFRDYLAPVPTEIVTKIGLESDFLDVYKNDLKENNQWLSVPIMYDGLALFYNKELLDTAGIPIPDDWWELREAAIKLTTKNKDGTIDIAGVALGLANKNIDHWSDIIGLMLKQNGIDLNGLSSATDKNLEDALKFYVSFVNSEAENVWDETLPNSTVMFANGKLAFYFGPSWRVFDIEKLNKDLKFGITALPQLPINGGVKGDDTQLTDIHWSTYWTEGVNNKSKYQDIAWKFLDYLSSKEVLEKLYAAESQTRSFGEIYPRKSMSESLKNNSKVWPFLSVANKASSWYLADATGDDGVNTEMQKYFANAIDVINQDNNTGTMTTLKNGISQLKTKYGLRK